MPNRLKIGSNNTHFEYWMGFEASPICFDSQCASYGIFVTSKEWFIMLLKREARSHIFMSSILIYAIPEFKTLPFISGDLDLVNIQN